MEGVGTSRGSKFWWLTEKNRMESSRLTGAVDSGVTVNEHS